MSDHGVFPFVVSAWTWWNNHGALGAWTTAAVGASAGASSTSPCLLSAAATAESTRGGTTSFAEAATDERTSDGDIAIATVTDAVSRTSAIVTTFQPSAKAPIHLSTCDLSLPPGPSGPMQWS